MRILAAWRVSRSRETSLIARASVMLPSRRGPHPQRVQHGGLRLGQALLQPVLAVVVHQEADAAAIHPVDRDVAAEPAVLRLQHAAIAAERDDRRGLLRRHFAIARRPAVAAAAAATSVAAAWKAIRPRKSSGCSTTGCGKGHRGHLVHAGITALAAIEVHAPGGAMFQHRHVPPHPRRHRRVDPRRRPADAVRDLGHHMPPGIGHQRMPVDRARLAAFLVLRRWRRRRGSSTGSRWRGPAAAPPNGPCRSAG